jgi:hypothetical protein
MAEPSPTQARAPQVEPEPLPPVVNLAEAAHRDPAQAAARLGTGSRDGASMLIVVPYDPTWPQRFQAASAEILAATDHLFLRLEHIGSTSVPGLAAKPTIDMMASVRRLPDGHAAQPALAASAMRWPTPACQSACSSSAWPAQALPPTTCTW